MSSPNKTVKVVYLIIEIESEEILFSYHTGAYNVKKAVFNTFKLAQNCADNLNKSLERKKYAIYTVKR